MISEAVPMETRFLFSYIYKGKNCICNESKGNLYYCFNLIQRCIVGTAGK